MPRTGQLPFGPGGRRLPPEKSPLDRSNPPRGGVLVGMAPPPTRGPGVGAASGWQAGVAGVATILGTVGATFTIFFAMGRRPMDVCLDTEWTRRYGCHPRTLPPISYTFNNLPERYCAIPGCVLASLLMSRFYQRFYQELQAELRRRGADPPPREQATLWAAHAAGQLACVGMVATATVSMKMHSYGHALAAFVFFLCGIAHILLAFRLQVLLVRHSPEEAQVRLLAPTSLPVRNITLALFAVLFVALVVLFSALPRGTVLQVVFPPAQWWTVASCLLGNLSLALDLRHMSAVRKHGGDQPAGASQA